MQIIFLKKFKVTIIKIQNRTVKEVITKWKGSLLNERTYTSAPSDKGLISQICKELIQIHIKNINNPIWKWAENLNRNTDGQRTCKKIFGMVNHQWNANQNHNDLSPHTCQNGYYQKDNTCFWGYGENGTLMHCGNVNWCSHHDKIEWKFLKKLKTEVSYMIQQLHFWVFAKESKQTKKKY